MSGHSPYPSNFSPRIGDAGADALGSALSADNVPGKGIGRKLVLSCNTITVAGLKSLEDALRESGPVHRLAVEGVRGGNLERRAAVERECKPRIENAAAIQSGRLETVVPKPPRKPPKTGRAPPRRGTMTGGNVAAQPGAASSRSVGGTKSKFASVRNKEIMHIFAHSILHDREGERIEIRVGG